MHRLIDQLQLYRDLALLQLAKYLWLYPLWAACQAGLISRDQFNQATTFRDRE